VNISTFANRCSNLADIEIIIKPNSDLAIQNYILREIVFNRPEAIDREFVDRNCIFATGFVDIGYGLRPKTDHPKYKKEELDTASRRRTDHNKGRGNCQEPRDQVGDKMEMKHAAAAGTLDDLFRGLQKVEPYAGLCQLAKGDADESLEDFKKKLMRLADLYTEKGRKVVSFWTMGFNQHVRGTWVNEQIYAIHLLLGKQSQPCNGAFSLADGERLREAREVGTFPPSSC
jgi:nitrate reductase NapA